MKARFIALLLSIFITSYPAQADNNHQALKPSATEVIARINLNKADVSSLTGSFKGIGKKRAEAIIEYRESHHGFKSIEELAYVRGIGQRFVDKNREKLKEIYEVS
ncbi:ComEA family DNA-binding protein [Legionella waltersii]|uniref:Competence protein ComEA n=1 Tax=Legionella waltersii TaxID=66969 RepID=A0A0W1ANA4_9GAMM|nr:helix-hairpin-helix domain-containing protein [Legionella waltersii]KTD82799.1 competence protein ComEA [Legionella waltersii]SNV01422.1 competence protein ComEA [Legionella waltersii]